MNVYRLCHDIATANEGKGYRALADAFAKAYMEHINAGRAEAAARFKLLSDVCSLFLQKEGSLYVYIPGIRSTDGRSADLRDFSEADFSRMQEMLPHLGTPALKARLLDVIKEGTKNNGLARKVAEETLRIPIEAESWVVSFRMMFSKALFYCTHFFSKDTALQQSFEEKLTAAAEDLPLKSFGLAFSLSELMLEFRLLTHGPRMASALLGLGEESERSAAYANAARCYAEAAKWRRCTKDEEAAAQMTVRQAHCRRLHGQQLNALVYRGELQNAILILQEIKNEYKTQWGLWGTIKEWQRELDRMRPGTAAAMKLHRTEGIDLASTIRRYKTFISGKSKEEALQHFPLLDAPFNRRKAERDVIDNVRQYPLVLLFPETRFGKDGRQIADLPGISDFEHVTTDHPRVQSEVLNTYRVFCYLQVYGLILPVLNLLHHEHEVTMTDFAPIVDSNPYIPDEHKFFFVRGLFAGYNYDFALSLHFLAPQLEQMFRRILQAHGETTVHIDGDKREDEKGLNSLLKHDIIRNMLDEDLLFEMEAMFCNPLGPNIRNHLAHGLIGYRECSTVPFVYAWWLVWRLLSMMHEHHTGQPNEPEVQRKTE